MAAFVWGSGGKAMTPEQRERERMVANAMMAKAVDTSPVQHWTQGAARVAQAIAGAYGNYKLDEQEKTAAEGNRKHIMDIASAMGGQKPADTAPVTPVESKPLSTPSQKVSGAFDQIGPRLSQDLAKDFGLAPHQTAGIVGNLAHESGGFGTLQEVKPMIPGSRGGYGYAQWTGPRRKQFEAFAQAQGLDPSSYEANYGFLAHELKNTPEGNVLADLRQAPDAQAATQIFSNKFLRPGIPHMDSRSKWADRALGFAGQPMAGGQGVDQIQGNAGQDMLQSPDPRLQQVMQAMTADQVPVGQRFNGQMMLPDVASGQPEQLVPTGMPTEMVAQAMMAQPQQAAPQVIPAPEGAPQGIQQVAQAMGPQGTPGGIHPAIAAALSDPNASPMVQKYALSVLEQQMTPQKPIEVNGRLVDPKTFKVVADFSEKPKPIEVSGRLVDPTNGNVIADYSEAPKPTVVSEGGMLVDPDGKIIAQNPKAPEAAKPDKLRTEIQGLPSYKNFQQAAPIYQSMVETAGRNTKASDLNLVYGLGKIMDPTSVVREGEMVMVKNTASLPDWLQGAIASLNGGAALTPETRKAIMDEAFGRMKNYETSLGGDLQQYKGIVGRNQLNEADVIPTLPQLQQFSMPQPALPEGVSEEDVLHTMQKHGVSREEVLKRLGR